jgi:hypothetical protein
MPRSNRRGERSDESNLSCGSTEVEIKGRLVPDGETRNGSSISTFPTLATVGVLVDKDEEKIIDCVVEPESKLIPPPVGHSNTFTRLVRAAKSLAT